MSPKVVLGLNDSVRKSEKKFMVATSSNVACPKLLHRPPPGRQALWLQHYAPSTTLSQLSHYAGSGG